MALNKSALVAEVELLLASGKPGGILAADHRQNLLNLIDKVYDENIDGVSLLGIELTFTRNGGDGAPIVIELPDTGIEDAPDGTEVFARKEGEWVETMSKTELDLNFDAIAQNLSELDQNKIDKSPVDGIKYVLLDYGIEEAPIQDDAPADTKEYVRKNNAWVENTGGSGGGEINTASSQGGGASLVLAKVGADLPFRSIAAAGLVGVAVTPNEVVITGNQDANKVDTVPLAPENNVVVFGPAGQVKNGNTTVAAITNSINSKADKTVTISSTQPTMVEVQNPTLADNVVLNIRSNVPNGVVKLNSFGLVPLALLPSTNLSFVGVYDASTNTLPPNRATQFEYFVISNAGTLMLVNTDLAPPVSTSVLPNDEIVYLSPGLWAFKPASQTATLATSVIYNNSNSGLISTDVQGAIDEVVAINDSKANELISVLVVTVGRQLLLSDTSKLIAANNLNFAIPTNAQVAFPIGTQILFANTDTGNVGFTKNVGVDVISYEDKLNIGGRGASGTLTKILTNTWLLIGNLS